MPVKKMIAIEGVDGAGKTTIALKLAEKLDFDYVKTPAGHFCAMRSMFDMNDVPVSHRFLFYSWTVLETVKQALVDSKAKGLVLDRYTLSLWAYHLTAGMDENKIRQFFQTVIFPKPDMNLILTSSPEVIEDRLQERGIRLSSWENSTFLTRVNSIMCRPENGILYENSGNFSPDQIAENIADVFLRREAS